MNSFGRLFRISLYGESHGPVIGVIIDGVKPGIELKTDHFAYDINRRKPGEVGTTRRIEADLPILKSGLFNDFTTGAPLCIEFANSEQHSSDYIEQLKIPRPGHTDFVASKKFKNYNDYRGGGHFSGRLSLLLVAAAVVAKKMIPHLEFETKILSVANESVIEKGIQKAVERKDSVGGIIQCRVKGLSIGLGEPFFDSIESVLSHLIFSIPAIKGVEFGSGFGASKMFGSEHNDALIDSSGKTKTNHSGGVSGGITNGNDLIVRVAVKPTSSTPAQQTSLNVETNQLESFQVKGRHDLCIALRVPVILEAAVAIGLCDMNLISNSLT